MTSVKSIVTAGILLAATTALAHADVVIATAGPMTGPYAVFGKQMKDGAEQAVADLNAAGGVLGETVVLKIGDDACDPKQAVAVANQFAGDGVVFVAGHFCSGSSIPASDVYDEEGILQISPASTNPQLTEAGKPLVFRTCGRDDQQGTVAGNFMADTFAGKKIAIVHDKQAYSKGLADETKKQLNARGVQEVIYDTVTPGEKDYSALVSKLKAGGIEILYYGGYHTEAGLIVRQMRDQGMDTVLIVSVMHWSPTSIGASPAISARAR
jgi:branched-chain amino acid transport system substrate-binding protein